jgi:aspartyl-tRNA(Asn)/glutamyl-tRNA(Gln) amidotransferase subunit A
MSSNDASGLTALTLAEARDGLARKEFSAKELAEAHLQAIEAARALNAFITLTPERALAMAAESDHRLARGAARPLEGIPLAIKDLFCTQGVRTTAGSRILENFVPPYESTVTANLWRAGAVLLGKTNLDEFAMGSSNVTSYFGPVINPWTEPGADRPLVPGGSSGGSAAAVAAHLCLGATGTDTGGSIRQPAALSGIVGIKPTYGRCSRFGIVAFASSLDQAGPLARTVRDGAILLQQMAGHDPHDSTSADVPLPDLEAALTGEVRGLRVGIPKEYRLEGSPPEIVELWQHGEAWLRSAGCELREVSLPHTRYALPAYYIVNPAEASSNLARYDGMRYGLRIPGKDLVDTYAQTRAAGFGKEVRRRVMIGTYVLSAGYYEAYYIKAQKVRSKILGEFKRAFEQVDLLLTPATPNPAFRIGDKMDDPVAMYLNDVFTVPANLAGLPGIAVPAGLSRDGLPLGLQLIAQPFDEATLFRAAGVLEEAAGFRARPLWPSAQR